MDAPLTTAVPYLYHSPAGEVGGFVIGGFSLACRLNMKWASPRKVNAYALQISRWRSYSACLHSLSLLHLFS